MRLGRSGRHRGDRSAEQGRGSGDGRRQPARARWSRPASEPTRRAVAPGSMRRIRRGTGRRCDRGEPHGRADICRAGQPSGVSGHAQHQPSAGAGAGHHDRGRGDCPADPEPGAGRIEVGASPNAATESVPARRAGRAGWGRGRATRPYRPLGPGADTARNARRVARTGDARESPASAAGARRQRRSATERACSDARSRVPRTPRQAPAGAKQRALDDRFASSPGEPRSGCRRAPRARAGRESGGGSPTGRGRRR